MWPARSPYLKMCDVFFCLWGLLKNEAYSINRRTEDGVKSAVRMRRLQCAPSVLGLAISSVCPRFQVSAAV
jgi:hypothetical protein